MNDPFDLSPLDTRDPAVAEAVSELNREIWSRRGILCFSRNWDNLLLWSHYGAAHTGICLGFDISESDYGTDVQYQPNLMQIRSLKDVNLNLANRLIRTKHECWSYEQEVRLFVDLHDPPDEKGLHWMEFGSSFVLKEVIVGAQCHPDDSKKVQEATKPYGDAVEFWWAGMRPDAFLIVKQNQPPWWHSAIS
ncbi:DUF2971 domain-containing protein [Terriglobus sp. TAA 43]|uniref:DUF2971 domain-containing protein n=1 Tax=Terriglobus sp. TAA 43 TaxID=278961 RepID=UPI0018DC8465|nr:DUF2971 domain-containing protein [Terriglobus sp. TAA 43]